MASRARSTGIWLAILGLAACAKGASVSSARRFGTVLGQDSGAPTSHDASAAADGNTSVALADARVPTPQAGHGAGDAATRSDRDAAASSSSDAAASNSSDAATSSSDAAASSSDAATSNSSDAAAISS